MRYGNIVSYCLNSRKLERERRLKWCWRFSRSWEHSRLLHYPAVVDGWYVVYQWRVHSHEWVGYNISWNSISSVRWMICRIFIRISGFFRAWLFVFHDIRFKLSNRNMYLLIHYWVLLYKMMVRVKEAIYNINILDSLLINQI